MKRIKASVLDLGPIRKGKSIRDAIEDMVTLVRAVEQLGYTRYWVAEHHNSSSIISSATTILMKHLLENTKSIRVGSGGIMLPNHSPLVVAEQIGTLAQIYPGRIDLGLGRAPGTDQLTSHALKRSSGESSVYSFPQDIQQLLKYFGPKDEQSYVKANVAIGTNVPIYILGSSIHSAKLAAHLGLPYAFAAHFAPTYMEEAISIYRNEFKPSRYLDAPYMIVCLNIIATETDEEAKYQFSTTQQMFLNLVRGQQSPLLPPIENLESQMSSQEKMAVSTMINMSMLGDRNIIRQHLIDFQDKYSVDEIMAVSYIYDQKAQIKSYEIFKEVIEEFNSI